MSGPATITDPAGPKIGPGALVLVVGPSGAGKDTLINAAKEMLGDGSPVVFPRRAVTRAASAFENNEAVTPAEFERAVADNAYALWWRAHDQGYGVPRTIDDELRRGRTVVINVSRTIIAAARASYQRPFVVLITAPPEVLAARLAARKRESDRDLGERLQRAALDTEAADLVISNVGPVADNARKLAQFIGALHGI